MLRLQCPELLQGIEQITAQQGEIALHRVGFGDQHIIAATFGHRGEEIRRQSPQPSLGAVTTNGIAHPLAGGEAEKLSVIGAGAHLHHNSLGGAFMTAAGGCQKFGTLLKLAEGRQ